MPRYESFSTRAWRDPLFYSLPPDGKLSWLWLLTNEQSTSSGLQEVCPPVMAGEVGISPERAGEILTLFEAAGKVARDGDLVWIVRRFDYRPNSPKVREAVLRELRLHAKSHLSRQCWERYRHYWPEPERSALQGQLEVLWEGVRSIPKPSIDRSGQSQTVLNQNQTNPISKPIPNLDEISPSEVDQIRSDLREKLVGNGLRPDKVVTGLGSWRGSESMPGDAR